MNCGKFCLGLLCIPVVSLQFASVAALAEAQNAMSSEATRFPFKTSFYQPAMTESRLTEAISAVDKLAQKQIDEKRVPGLAISIVHNDKVVFSKGYGVRVVGAPDHVDGDTVFQLASVSKPLASTVVAGFVGDGKLSWDSKISKLDPEFEMFDPWVTRELTVRDLFAHRSGLPDHAADELEDIGYDRLAVLHRLRYLKPDSSFRSAYAYTNYGLTEGAVAAAKVCGLGWEAASESRLYKPLGMNSTSSRYADYDGRSNKALGHVLVDGKWVQKYRRQPDGQAPAGGASSSVNDMAKWMRLQLAGGKFDGQQVISQAALDETHHPHMLTRMSPITGLPEFYGLGFNVSYDQSGRLHLGHSGGFSRGAATCIRMLPDESLGICVLTNAYPIGVAEGLVGTFSDVALYGQSTQDWLPLFKKILQDPASLGMLGGLGYQHAPVAPTAALKKDAYIGTYSNSFVGDIEIAEAGSGSVDGANSGFVPGVNSDLVLKIGPKKMVFPLKHYDRDIFTYDPDAEDLDGISGLRFDVTSDGKAARVLIENLNANGEGLFERQGM